jgi:hypothetical protein
MSPCARCGPGRTLRRRGRAARRGVARTGRAPHPAHRDRRPRLLRQDPSRHRLGRDLQESAVRPPAGTGRRQRVARAAAARSPRRRHHARRGLRRTRQQSGTAAVLHRHRRTRAHHQPGGLLPRLARRAAGADFEARADPARGGDGAAHARRRRQSSRFLHLPLPAAPAGRCRRAAPVADRPASRPGAGADAAPLARQGSGRAVFFRPRHRPDAARRPALPQDLFRRPAARRPARRKRAARGIWQRESVRLMARYQRKYAPGAGA